MKDLEDRLLERNVFAMQPVALLLNLNAMQNFLFYYILALKSEPIEVCKYNYEQDRKRVLSSTDNLEKQEKKVAQISTI
jgi:hypothetical protein